jgi:hypothetical protein
MTAITTAARLLRVAADELKNAHTLGGDWGNEHEALDAYNEHMATATTLEHMSRQCLAQIEEPAAPAAVASALDVTLDEDQAGLLRDMLGDPAEYEEALTVRLIVCDGHSGHGLYVAQAEYQDEGAVLLTALPAPAAPALEAPAVPSRTYVAVLLCDCCGHIGINDASDGKAACNTCRWTGDSPAEDKCPGCNRVGTMTTACPECGARTSLIAETHLPAAAPQAPAAHVDDLAALVKKLVQALRKAAPNHVLPAQALDYLKRQGLQGSPLRAAEAAPQAPAAPAVDAPAPASEWRDIFTAEKSDDLIWLYDANSKTIDGPRTFGTYDVEEYTHWAPAEAPDLDGVDEAFAAAIAAQAATKGEHGHG